MLLLVFFLSHVDDSRDKVLKLAPLRQAAVQGKFESASLTAFSVYFSKRHLDMTPEVLLPLLLWDMHICVCSASTCDLYQYTCPGLMVRTCMHAVQKNRGCCIMSPWLLSLDQFQLNASCNSRASSPSWRLSYGVTWRPGSCLPNTPAPLPSVPHWSPFRL